MVLHLNLSTFRSEFRSKIYGRHKGTSSVTKLHECHKKKTEMVLDLRLQALTSRFTEWFWVRFWFPQASSVIKNILEIKDLRGFSGGSAVNYLPAVPKTQARQEMGFDPWFGKFPWRRKWQPIAVFLSGRSHEQSIWQATQSMRLQRVQQDQRNLAHKGIWIQIAYYMNCRINPFCSLWIYYVENLLVFKEIYKYLEIECQNL